MLKVIEKSTRDWIRLTFYLQRYDKHFIVWCRSVFEVEIRTLKISVHSISAYYQDYRKRSSEKEGINREVVQKGRVKQIWISFSENAIGNKVIDTQSPIRMNSYIKQTFFLMLVNNMIWVSSIQFYNTSAVHV